MFAQAPLFAILGVVMLCSLQALAAAAALRDQVPDRLVIAGYSVGEVAAWGVAGLLSMTDTLDLVARRAEAMDAAASAGEGLLFVRGLSREAIDKLCERHDAAIAIVNPDDGLLFQRRDPVGTPILYPSHSQRGRPAFGLMAAITNSMKARTFAAGRWRDGNRA